MTLTLLRIGTRKSPLAMAQAAMVRDLLAATWPQLSIELVPMLTSGDRYHDQTLSDIGGKGLFTKEIEEALLDRRIDIAVHSMKDMQTILPQGLVIAALLPREDVRDALVGKGLSGLGDLPKGATIGTSSLRRAALIKLACPDVAIAPLRGSVGTRLKKLEDGTMSATLLAVAGLKRLGILASVPAVPLTPDDFLPAIAQGALGIECREGDDDVRALIAPLNDLATQVCVECERAFLRALDGSCRTPIAGYARLEKNRVVFDGLVAAPDGSASERTQGECAVSEGAALGRDLGEELKARPRVTQMLTGLV